MAYDDDEVRDFSAVNNIYDMAMRGEYGGQETAAGIAERTPGMYSALSPEVLAMDELARRAGEWQIGKSLYNGLVVYGGRGILGVLKMARDKNILEHAEAGNLEQYQIDNGQAIEDAINSTALQRYETNPNFVNNLAEGAGQYIGQIAVSAATGGWGGAAYMGAQIAGNQYIDLTQEGVSTDRAAIASVANAAFQTPLEKIGLSKVLHGNRNPLKRKVADRVKDVAEAMLSEGLTEFVQEFPEQLTDLWARNVKASAGELGEKWWENKEQNVKDALWSGVIGSILGGMGASARVSYNAINEHFMQKAHAVLQEAHDEQIKEAKKSGLAPEQIKVVIDSASQGANTIHIEADKLNEFLQTQKPGEVSQLLGVSDEDVQAAAISGLTVEVSRGAYDAAAVKYDGFAETMRDYIYYSGSDYSANEIKLKFAQRRFEGLGEEEQIKLDAALDGIINSAAEAGVSKTEQAALRALLASHAMRWGDQWGRSADEYFTEHSVTFEKGEDGKVHSTWLRSASLRPDSRAYETSDTGSVSDGNAEEGLGASPDIDESHLKNYRQEGETIKGAYVPLEDGSALIKMFSAHDASTTVHETGHYFFENFMKDSAREDAPESVKKDRAAFLKYAGMTEEEWQTADIEGRRAAHERIVEAFESYIIEGKAPVPYLRSLFRRFSKWLRKVYSVVRDAAGEPVYDASLRSENAVELTPEVREAFDHWFASEAEIEAAERIDGMLNALPFINELSEGVKDKLLEYAEGAREKALGIMVKAALKDFAPERRAAMAKYSEEQQPLVEEALRNGAIEEYGKLYAAAFSFEEQTSSYNEKQPGAHARDIARRYLKDPGKIEPEAREAFEMCAELFGYDNAGAFAQELLDKPTYKQAVEKELHKRVREKFPGYNEEYKDAAEAAREALINEDSEALAALELELIAEKAQGLLEKDVSAQERKARIAQFKAAAKLAAKAEIARMDLATAIDHKRFARAERRAAREAARALKDNDYEGAAEYKRRQLFLHNLLRESLALRDQIAKDKAFLRKLARAKKETWGTEQHLGQAGALMARLGIRLKGYTPEMKRQTLQEYAAEMQAKYGDEVVNLPPWLFDEAADLSNRNALTSEQYRDVINAVKNLLAIARQDKRQAMLDRGKSIAEVKAEVREHLDKLPAKFTASPSKRGKAGALDRFLHSLRNTDNFFEMMDNWTYGYFSRTWGQRLKACADAEALMTMAHDRRRVEGFLEMASTSAERAALEEEIYYPELGDSASRLALIQMACNLGNDGNTRVLCLTPVFKNSPLWVKPSDSISEKEAIEMTRANIVAFLGKHLEEKHIRYAQKLIDNANYYWPQLAELNRRTQGFAPPKVEATPITFTLADGKTVTIAGGYFPLVRNTEMGSHPAGGTAFTFDENNPGANLKTMHTNTGSSQARVKANYPISLWPGAEERALRATIHDIAYRETMADFRAIFNDPAIYAALKEKLGVAGMRQLQEIMVYSANPYGDHNTDMAEGLLASAMQWMRRRTVNASIIWNLKVIAQNLANAPLFGNAAEGFSQKDAWKAIFKYGICSPTFLDADRKEFIKSKSVYMRSRVLYPDFNVRDTLGKMSERKLSALEAAERKTLIWGAEVMAFTDDLTAQPVWLGAYEKKLSEGASDSEAVDFADMIIRRTLGSNRVQDVSSLQRGSELFRIFSMFQSFWNAQFNQWDREANIDYNLWKGGSKKEAAERMILFVASKWLFTCLISCCMALENPFGRDEKDEDDEKWKVWQYGWGKEMMQYPFSMLGPAGQAANMLLNNLMGNTGYGYRLSPVQSSIDRVFKIARTANRIGQGEAEPEEAIEPVANVLLPLVGVPDQISRLFFNAWDWVRGMDFEAEDIMRRRPKSKRNINEFKY